MRIRRSQTSSVAQEPWAPGMLKGLRLVGGATELTMTSRWAVLGLRLVQVQKLRMPMPAWTCMEDSSQTVWLKATRFLGWTMKP